MRPASASLGGVGSLSLLHWWRVPSSPRSQGTPRDENIIAARTKNTQQVEDEDRKLVRYGKRLGGHYIAWPREWCNQEEAAGRGAMTVNELWPDETAEPIAHRRFTWVQRTRRM